MKEATLTNGTSRVNAGVSPGTTALLDAVDLPILVISRDCTILHVNRAATTTLGLSASDIGRSPGKLFPGLENLDRFCEPVFTDGVPCRREIRVGDRHFLFRIAPHMEDDRIADVQELRCLYSNRFKVSTWSLFSLAPVVRVHFPICHC